ncbi:MAG: hypothetical protein ACK53J_16715, partial [Betaproteobacteria bacterium]
AVRLRRELQQAMGRGTDAITRAHLAETLAMLDEALKASLVKALIAFAPGGCTAVRSLWRLVREQGGSHRAVRSGGRPWSGPAGCVDYPSRCALRNSPLGRPGGLMHPKAP